MNQSPPQRRELPVPDTQDALPQAIGKYEVLGRVGVGAMGVVYKCSQPGLERPVAVKVMIAGRHASAEQIRRFQREAWAAAQLTHPNVLQIYDVGSEGELHYFVMEYVDGWSLDQLIGTPLLTLERTLRLVYQIARALEAAHARGIIHRDIKPSNILLSRAGQPKLADFGLAKSLDGGQNLSGSGDIIGTPRYMSPEQTLAVPEEVDARTDIYSLGAVMYEMLTGRPPVDGPNILTILRKLTDEEPVPIRALTSAVPDEAAALCQRAMAKTKEDRFPTAGEFAAALEGYLVRGFGSVQADSRLSLESASLPNAGRRYLSRRRVVAAALAVALLVLLVTGGVFYAGTRRTVEHPSASNRSPEEATDDTLEDNPPTNPAPSTTPETRTEATDASAARAIAAARDSLGGSLSMAAASKPYDRLRAIIEDLTPVVKRYPQRTEALLQRARAYRWAGEYLHAIDDLTGVLTQQPGNLNAATERMLASYQLRVLYLGNLNQTLLRPFHPEYVRDDVRLLLAKGSAAQKHMARLVEALAAQQYAEAGGIAIAGPPAGVAKELWSDLLMLEADALFHVMEAAYEEQQKVPDGSDKEAKRQRYEQLQMLATRAYRRGLDTNPNHVGLLFLKADSQRRAIWDAMEGDDRNAILRDSKRAFADTVDLLRRAASTGGETALARTVLLANFEQERVALDRLSDAITDLPRFHYLYTLQAWLRLQTPPPETNLTPEEVNHILRDLQRGFEGWPVDFNTFFVRALLYAAAGDWEKARRDLMACRKALGKRDLPAADPNFPTWLARSDVPSTRYLDATFDVLLGSIPPVPSDLPIRLGDEILGRLAKPEVLQQEKLQPGEVKKLTGLTYFRLAKVCAGRNDREKVLNYVLSALNQELPEVRVRNCREDGNLAQWNEDPDFVELYRWFEGL
jgi:serine/threonine protein kinase